MKRRLPGSAFAAVFCVLLLAACRNPWVSDLVDVFFKEKKPEYSLPVLTRVSDVAGYLAAQSGGTGPGDPVRLRMSIELSAADWSGLLNVIAASGKYVNLDLSACTRSMGGSTGGGLYAGGIFDADITSATDKSLITGMTLPGAATGIRASSFQNFSNLQSVSAAAVTTIGNNAFNGCGNLNSVNFPKATDIGASVFQAASA